MVNLTDILVDLGATIADLETIHSVVKQENGSPVMRDNLTRALGQLKAARTSIISARAIAAPELKGV